MDFAEYMRVAFDEAKASLKEGNHGFGAVVVKDGVILARAHDQDTTLGDPTSHAELNAIRLAAFKTGGHVAGCVMVATHEPCPMCASAMVWAGIREIAYGYSIAHALAEGRRRIDLTCQELYARAGIVLTVHPGVLQAECALLYRSEVRAEVARLRGATTAADWERLQRAMIDKRVGWYRENAERLTIDTSHPALAGYRLLLAKFGIEADQAPVVARTEREVVFHSTNFCPTLEACRLLDLDTRQVCRAMTEAPADALVKQLDARLTFSRNYDVIRPYSPYCEERVTLDNRSLS